MGSCCQHWIESRLPGIEYGYTLYIPYWKCAVPFIVVMKLPLVCVHFIKFEIGFAPVKRRVHWYIC